MVLRIDESRAGREAGLLERADRGEVADVRVGDACLRLGTGEDDLRDEGTNDVGAETRPGQARLAEERSSPAASSPASTSAAYVGIVGEKVRLNEPDGFAAKTIA